MHDRGWLCAWMEAAKTRRLFYPASPSFGRHLQHEPFVGRREFDLTGEPAFRANVLCGEIQGIALDSFGRFQQTFAFGRHIDMEGPADAGAASFSDNILNGIAPRRLHGAFANFGGDFSTRSARLYKVNVGHAAPPSNKL